MVLQYIIVFVSNDFESLFEFLLYTIPIPMPSLGGLNIYFVLIFL